MSLADCSEIKSLLKAADFSARQYNKKDCDNFFITVLWR